MLGLKEVRDVVRVLNETYPPKLIQNSMYYRGEVIEVKSIQENKYFSAYYSKQKKRWTIWCQSYPLMFSLKEIEKDIKKFMLKQGIRIKFDYGLPVTVSVLRSSTRDVRIVPKEIYNVTQTIKIPSTDI